MTNLPWNRHHIISLADFIPAEYDSILQTALSFQGVLARRTKKVPTLQGQVVANLFFLSRLLARAAVLNLRLSDCLPIRLTFHRVARR